MFKILKISIFLIQVILFQTISYSQVECDTLILTSNDTLIITDLEYNDVYLKFAICNSESKDEIEYQIKKSQILKINKHKASKRQLRNKIVRDTLEVDIYLEDKKEIKLARINQINNSSILVSPKKSPKIELQIKDIKRIKVREKNRLGEYTLLGVAIGGSFGFFVGSILKDDELPLGNKSFSFNNDFRLFLTANGILMGGIAGVIIGSVNVNVPINGNNEMFERLIKRFEY